MNVWIHMVSALTRRCIISDAVPRHFSCGAAQHFFHTIDFSVRRRTALFDIIDLFCAPPHSTFFEIIDIF